MIPAATILAQVDFAETHPPNAPRYSRYPFFLSFPFSTAAPWITSFSPSFLATTQSSYPRYIPPALCPQNSIGFWRYEQLHFRKNPIFSLFLFRVESVVLSPSGVCHLSSSRTYSSFSVALMPNYLNVTGVARRLFQANSWDFRKFIGPPSGNSQPCDCKDVCEFQLTNYQYHL